MLESMISALDVFLHYQTTFTLRKIDLHIEQAVGHKFASRWRFLETVVRVSQRKLRVYLDKICAQAKPVRVQAKR